MYLHSQPNEDAMARPKKGAEIGATSTIGVRVSGAMRDAIEREAARTGRTLTDEVRTLLDEALLRRNQPKKRAA